MQIVQDDVALITGAGGGIGSALARALLDRGAKLALADIDPASAEAVRAALGAPADRVRAVGLDVVDVDAWRRGLAETETALGPVSILVNNAGIGNVCPLAEEDPERWRLVLMVNAYGPFLGCRLALPGMIARGRGHIVNLASTAGLTPVPGMTSYVAGKHAVVGLSESLRVELEGSGVGVTVIAPGAVATSFFANSAVAIARRAVAAPELERDPLVDGITAERVGRRIALAIERDERLVLTHPEWRDGLQAFYTDRIGALGDPA